jgi:hypothetical protein
MVDNLFVVESPLQALIALELNLRFKGDKNGIVYRVAENRERNNRQIEDIISRGSWSFKKRISFNDSSVLSSHKSILRELNCFRKIFSKGTGQLFIGEFRSQWMHFMRTAVSPKKTILMDDGAATLISKRKYIDKGIYFPEELWRTQSLLKRIVKRIIYRKFLTSPILRKPVFFASAFLRSESIYPISFSEIKKIFESKKVSKSKPTVFFFGSKYSEAKIISLKYEINFLQRVKGFYSKSNLDIIYCAHRDESKAKLSLIENELKFKVVAPDSPAEVFLLGQVGGVTEVAGAYSSVLNNVKVIFPEIMVRAFYLNPEEINIKNRNDISNVYRHYKIEGINVEF